MTARRQPSSRYLLAAEIPQRYDGSRRHDDKLVIPLLVSGIYAEISRRYDVGKPFLG
ncbi:hypothetical protein [Wolbachia endosymbiont (group A) of Platycheirus albimanus]|uniref:hypothetical protein n=1 Tax=Wolbachia endosymbiont (group A) of Platycheirus albimanus TaxID=2954048 RepID=UPI00222083B9|nr:hypothetical protein [Wolbachia endosymbiont (group A) of Platycheirus albimanus]